MSLKGFQIFFFKLSKEESEVQLESEITCPMVSQVISFFLIPQITGMEAAVVSQTRKRKMGRGREVTTDKQWGLIII